MVLSWVFCRWGLRSAKFPHLGARFLILCRWGLRRFSRLKFYADGGYVFQMGATLQKKFRWGLRSRRWGRHSPLFCRWGLRISVHTQMGAAFEILFRWGLRFRRWGWRSQVFCTWGLRISVHTQMGAAFNSSPGKGCNSSSGGGDFSTVIQLGAIELLYSFFCYCE